MPKNELTKEQIEKAMACETAEELMAAAKAEGFELDEATLKQAAGGGCYAVDGCAGNCLVVKVDKCENKF